MTTKKLTTLFAAAALATLLVSPPVSGYTTKTTTYLKCTVNTGAGVNYAGQNQAAISSSDRDCKEVYAALFNGGAHVLTKSDTTFSFSAVAVSSKAADKGSFDYQTASGVWGGHDLDF